MNIGEQEGVYGCKTRHRLDGRKRCTHPGGIGSRNLINPPHEVLEVGNVPLPIIPPVISGINNEELLPDMGLIVGRPRIAVLFVGRAAIRSARTWRSPRLLEAVVTDIFERERTDSRAGARDRLLEVRDDVRVGGDGGIIAEDGR